MACFPYPQSSSQRQGFQSCGWFHPTPGSPVTNRKTKRTLGLLPGRHSTLPTEIINTLMFEPETTGTVYHLILEIQTQISEINKHKMTNVSFQERPAWNQKLDSPSLKKLRKMRFWTRFPMSIAKNTPVLKTIPNQMCDALAVATHPIEGSRSISLSETGADVAFLSFFDTKMILVGGLLSYLETNYCHVI